MEIELTVDGKEIAMNDFVQSILSGTIAGAVEHLHGVDDEWQQISIRINK
ncbi:conserved hypothetical protein [Methanosalsum zhilinae DSM 4017]|uniref:Uncharacterized protein n=1 Tax=Methanosalsum zhilinae (strain DSM 4017 / NBRC 107636 / OCM 62 / WeN5) TaxID=679901 RepID=F7XPY6_METZD|nr:hypothetical protein [Methanosalsum zhilinae]AEH61509.1 conserved hypothetical protein [Methanosalsum zhilinae DSM 4017]